MSQVNEVTFRKSNLPLTQKTIRSLEKSKIHGVVHKE